MLESNSWTVGMTGLHQGAYLWSTCQVLAVSQQGSTGLVPKLLASACQLRQRDASDLANSDACKSVSRLSGSLECKNALEVIEPI